MDTQGEVILYLNSLRNTNYHSFCTQETWGQFEVDELSESF